MMIHPLADVQSNNIGAGTRIWQFSVILEGAQIGLNCNINCHTFIENDVIIGDNVTVKSGVFLWDGIKIGSNTFLGPSVTFLWDGIKIGSNTFLGPSVTFVNNPYPRSQQYPEEHIGAIVGFGVSIGANSTIMGGINIGDFAMVGAGSVVTKDIPARALVYGVPAAIKGWLNDDGTKMKEEGEYWIANDNTIWKVIDGNLLKV